MNHEKMAQMKQWVEAWQRAGVRLEQLRQSELPLISTSQSLLALADAYEACRLHFSPQPYSGLIEQQAWFEKYRAMQEAT